MFPAWLVILCALAAITGLYLLIRSISAIIALYNNPNTVEFPASEESGSFEIRQTGQYEIAIIKPALFGVIPYKVSFELTFLESNTPVTVQKDLNMFSQRKNLSGERVVPVATFNAVKTGKYLLIHSSADLFKEKDRIKIMPATGYKGFALIFAILFAVFLFIGGSVIFLISLFA